MDGSLVLGNDDWEKFPERRPKPRVPPAIHNGGPFANTRMTLPAGGVYSHNHTFSLTTHDSRLDRGETRAFYWLCTMKADELRRVKFL